MIVGILKEIKTEENRVSMTPAGVEVMKDSGHTVLVEKSAGIGSGFEDSMYIEHGAEIVSTPGEIFERADMVMHVKEPLPPEYDLIREDQIVFTYLHLAAAENLTNVLLKSGSIDIAYETIQKEDGSLPLLTPMSEVAGRMAIQQGAKYLEMTQGGHGVLLGGVPGVDPGSVVIIGGGVVGTNAAKMACGLGAKVYVLDKNLDRLRYLSDVMPSNCFPLMSTPSTIRELVKTADVIVGAVLIPGAKAPASHNPRYAENYAAWYSTCGCLHRPGRVLRYFQCDHPRRSNLCGRWCCALLCSEYARRSRKDLHRCVNKRHSSLHAGNCKQGLEESHAGKSGDKIRR